MKEPLSNEQILEERLSRINIVLEGYKVMAGLSDPDPFKIQDILEKKLSASQSEVERLKSEAEMSLVRLKVQEDVLCL